MQLYMVPSVATCYSWANLTQMAASNNRLKPAPRDVILDSINEGVFTVDAEWRITEFNRAAERITGVSRKGAIGRRCCDVFHADICEHACALSAPLPPGALLQMRVPISSTGGETAFRSESRPRFSEKTRATSSGGLRPFRI